MYSKKLTVKQLYDEYIEAKQYETRLSSLGKTKSILRNHVLNAIPEHYVNKLTTQDLQKWKLGIEEKSFALITRQNIYGEFRAMLNFAVRMEYIPKNPLLKVGNFRGTLEIKKEQQFYTPEEFNAFILVARECAEEYEKEKNNLYEWNFYMFFNLAFYAGLRKGEIHSLQWNDIDGKYINVRRSTSQKLGIGRDEETATKNRSSMRRLQMPEPLIRALEEHKERQKKLGLYDGNRKILGDERCLRDSTLDKRNRQYAKATGVKRIRVHDFRHTHVTLLANMGVNIQEIARRLGHSDVRTTWGTYAHLYPQEEQHAIDVLNKVENTAKIMSEKCPNEDEKDD
ncbi:MAG: site-specific integrase [Clostridia bacterium]|nr:site-specific integrase [Clostridia bacterium]